MKPPATLVRSVSVGVEGLLKALGGNNMPAANAAADVEADAEAADRAAAMEALAALGGESTDSEDDDNQQKEVCALT